MKTILEKMRGVSFAPEAETGSAAQGSSSEGESVAANESQSGADNSSQGASDGSGDGDGSSTDVSVVAPDATAAVEPSAGAEDWRDKRIAKLTAKLKAAQAAATPAQAVVDPAAVLTDPAAVQTDFNRRVAEAAAAQRALETFNEACNRAAAEGKTKYGEAEFNKALNGLRRLVDESDPREVENYNTFVRAAIETGAPEDLIFSLGSDLTQAMKVLEMAPIKMAVELAKMASARPDPEGVSGLSKPIRPIGSASSDSRAQVDPTDKGRADSLSTSEWMKRREAQLASQSKH